MYCLKNILSEYFPHWNIWRWVTNNEYAFPKKKKMYRFKSSDDDRIIEHRFVAEVHQWSRNSITQTIQKQMSGIHIHRLIIRNRTNHHCIMISKKWRYEFRAQKVKRMWKWSYQLTMKYENNRDIRREKILIFSICEIRGSLSLKRDPSSLSVLGTLQTRDKKWLLSHCLSVFVHVTPRSIHFLDLFRHRHERRRTSDFSMSSCQHELDLARERWERSRPCHSHDKSSESHEAR